jgi:hypothetical protein
MMEEMLRDKQDARLPEKQDEKKLPPAKKQQRPIQKR